ncbi:MAG: hypothetical protein JNJ90_06365 [Saprospiraceae bacterium]|jgi:hypothetical protein|nr:hypothetical protein [Saprospiraceae bacterium]
MTQLLRTLPGLFLVFSFSLLVFSCTTDNEEQYPQLYQYHAVELGPTKIYVLTENSQNEITSFSGGITDDSLLTAGYQWLSYQFSPGKIELLDASQAQITAIDTFTIGYTREGDRITIGDSTLSGNTFNLDPDGTVMRLAIQCLQYAKKLPPGPPGGATTFYGPLNCDFATSSDALQFVAHSRAYSELKPGDTVAVNFSNFLFKRQ